jgi:hypothetical protein
MSIHEHMSAREKTVWIILLGVLLVVELRSINKDRLDQNHEFRNIGEGIRNELGKSDALIDLAKQNLTISTSLAATVQAISRLYSSSKDQKPIIAAWGAVSQLPTKAIDGAMATPEYPSRVQQGRRFVSAETLGSSLKDKEPSAATIINDGTNEAGNFAKQLEIGLRNAGWQTGGDNVKMGDPAFFPDSLTIEVSTIPASGEDHSIQEAKNLKAALERQDVEATVRFTDLRFPANFMRIKVAGR